MLSRRAFIGLATMSAASGSVLARVSPVRAQAAEPPVVFAAASLKDALDAVTKQWQGESGKTVKISYAASSALAKQIELGAPAAMFIAADLDWMDYVEQRRLIKSETRTNLLGNRLVLVAAKDYAEPVEIKPGFDLAVRLRGGRLAMASVDAVPAGKYGKAALEKLGVWSSVAARVAQAENVRAALLLVARGEAPFGIVYATDAAAEPSVKVVAVFPADTHPPIIYPVALTASQTHPDASAFLAYLKSGSARRLFEAQGFSIADGGKS